LLPTNLRAPVRERDIKLAWGEVSEDGYSISLYYTEPGSDSSFAEGFNGSMGVAGDLPNTRPVPLGGGLTGLFRPVSCGGSCAPANLWWQQNGATYQIQVKLDSGLAEKAQERILVELANSSVAVQPK
jgi:hypothetical protein